MEDSPTEDRPTRRLGRETMSMRAVDIARGRSGADLDGDGQVTAEERNEVLDQRLRVTERLARYALAGLGMLLITALLAGGYVSGVELDVLAGRFGVTAAPADDGGGE